MTNENVEIIDAVVEETVSPVEKIKTTLKNVDSRVYIATAGAVIGGILGFVAYKRIENFEAREAARLDNDDVIDNDTEV